MSEQVGPKDVSLRVAEKGSRKAITGKILPSGWVGLFWWEKKDYAHYLITITGCHRRLPCICFLSEFVEYTRSAPTTSLPPQTYTRTHINIHALAQKKKKKKKMVKPRDIAGNAEEEGEEEPQS